MLGLEDRGTIVTGVVESETLGPVADSDAEELAAAAFAAAAAGMGSARVEVTMTNPYAKATMELLRCVCIVIDCNVSGEVLRVVVQLKRWTSVRYEDRLCVRCKNGKKMRGVI